MRLKLILIIGIILIGCLTGGYIAIATGVPSISELKHYRALPGTKVYADDDTLIGEFKIEKGVFVSVDKIPAHLKNAVVAVEDSRFWQHKGLDYIGIGRALLTDILHGKIKEGGSTITQQLAKVLFLSPERTVKRKLREAQLAIKLEKELTKKEILELYLNKIYFGHGAHGVEMASRVYFGKSVTQLTLPESALLAGLIKAPNSYSPYNNLVKAKERQEVVLARMEEVGFISPSQRTKATKQSLQLSSLRNNHDAFNYFLEYVRQYLEQKYGEDLVYKGGLRVYATLDKRAQVLAQRALQDGLREVDKRRGWRGPIGHKEDLKGEDSESRVAFAASAGDISTGVVLSVGPKEAVVRARGIRGKLPLSDALWAATTVGTKGKTKSIKDFKLTHILKKGDMVWVKFKTVSGNAVTFSLEQEPEVEGAVVALDPDTGYIKSLVGGFSFTKSEYNRALYAKRQPGSSFKPIIYAAALENGFTPASVINDAPVSYHGAGGKEWKPENYDHKYYGPTRLREALAYSRNIVTVKLVEAVGIDKILSFARDIGIETPLPRDFTISLGSVGLTPFEMAIAYSTFANGGVAVKPIAIRYVTDTKENVLENNEPEGVESVSPQTAFLITSMMQDVIRYGTGMRANIGRPAAGKTGTSNEYKDAWFIGYTPQVVSCVWVGYDDMRRSLSHGEVGGRAAAPIWANFMRGYLSEEPSRDFSIPEGIIRVPVDYESGLFPSEIYEYFKDGTQPLEGGMYPVKSLRGMIESDSD